MRKLYGAAAAFTVAAGLMLGATGTAQAQTSSPTATHALTNSKATGLSRVTPSNVKPYVWRIYSSYANPDVCEQHGDQLVQMGLATQFYCQQNGKLWVLYINSVVRPS